MGVASEFLVSVRWNMAYSYAIVKSTRVVWWTNFNLDSTPCVYMYVLWAGEGVGSNFINGTFCLLPLHPYNTPPYPH